MIKKTPNVRSQNPDLGPFENEFADLRKILSSSARSERSVPQDYDRVDRQDYDRADRADDDRAEYDDYDGEYQDGDGSVPAFLADESYEPEEFTDNWMLRRRSSISWRILVGVLLAAAAAVLFALVTSDTTRAVFANAKTSIGGAVPDQSATPQPGSTGLTIGDLQLKDPTRLSTAPSIRSGGGAATNPTVAVAPSRERALAPSREDVTSAYPSTLQNNSVPLAAPPVATGSVRRLDADELSTLMRRARGLLAAGDIPSARLLLERAADAQEADAALLLAQTYDPQTLGTRDARKIKSDPATARVWYQRAAQLGSAAAQRRLSQLHN
jgi:hypothetical protein